MAGCCNCLGVAIDTFSVLRYVEMLRFLALTAMPPTATWPKPTRSWRWSITQTSQTSRWAEAGGWWWWPGGWFSMELHWHGSLGCWTWDTWWLQWLGSRSWSRKAQRPSNRTIPLVKPSRESLRPGLRPNGAHAQKIDGHWAFLWGSMLRVCNDVGHVGRQFESRSLKILYQVKRSGMISIAMWILWSPWSFLSHFSAPIGQFIGKSTAPSLWKRKSLQIRAGL